ncbi:uncharacterized protein PFL1_06524 [Pseudozyma flocculosa PF-1]|uniref:Tubulin-tyrosine ligase n=2 Tax=Pseudozyma flocculosa TaxID=84751 RepID=A0A061H183_9BASI|nr:uncharacterized protein PFL1_06524 [Pseudozyma flocculosa PF-1]EPQ25849.1 hypothetical protein PFL1_06524 [Pseudozyma flocculosa PF-1]SPO40653.1 related to PBY1 - putative tubulin tyrosine ligase [Pseudozyma flocculosa]
MATSTSSSACVCFPDAPYTQWAALRAAQDILAPQGWTVIDGCPAPSSSSSSSSPTPSASSATIPEVPTGQSLYLADYDLLPFEDLLPGSGSSAAQCSSYVIRKALIRKHYLASALHAFRVKRRGADAEAGSVDEDPTPRTWAFEIQFADELDELLVDDLYDLAQILDANARILDERGDADADAEDVQWFILKPGMADRGNGIRLFATAQQLLEIFEEFEPDSDDEDDDEEAADDGDEREVGYAGKDTSVLTSQLRHFVVQEYLSSPLLLDPPSTPDLDGALSSLSLSASPPSPPGAGRKFHLRAYVLCVGSLRVYLHDSMLALFAPLPYVRPTRETMTDLRPHLTNTCLQSDGSLAMGDAGRPKEENVWLWDDLVGCPIGDGGAPTTARRRLTEEDVRSVKAKAVRVIGTSFEACAKAGAVHWQMWPNSFEIFGVDLLVEHRPAVPGAQRGAHDAMDVKLLEINAQPDFAQTGKRLSATIDHLFRRTLQIAVLPFHRARAQQTSSAAASTTASHENDDDEGWNVGESRDGTTLCFRQSLQKAW